VASALSLGVDYRRHQLVYKFYRKQISARHGPLMPVPQAVDQMLTRQRAGRSTRQQPIPTDSCGRRPVSLSDRPKSEISTVRV
jgi:hypothetical protein